MTLYEINQAIQDLYDSMVDPETGEVSEDFNSMFDMLDMARGEKIEGSWANRTPMEGYRFYYPVQEDDNGNWCKCDKCLADPKLKDYRYRHFDWVNRILRKAKEKDPGIGVGTLA